MQTSVTFLPNVDTHLSRQIRRSTCEKRRRRRGTGPAILAPSSYACPRRSVPARRKRPSPTARFVVPVPSPPAPEAESVEHVAKPLGLTRWGEEAIRMLSSELGSLPVLPRPAPPAADGPSAPGR